MHMFCEAGGDPAHLGSGGKTFSGVFRLVYPRSIMINLFLIEVSTCSPFFVDGVIGQV